MALILVACDARAITVDKSDNHSHQSTDYEYRSHLLALCCSDMTILQAFLGLHIVLKDYAARFSPDFLQNFIT